MSSEQHGSSVSEYSGFFSVHWEVETCHLFFFSVVVLTLQKLFLAVADFPFFVDRFAKEETE